MGLCFFVCPVKRRAIAPGGVQGRAALSAGAKGLSFTFAAVLRLPHRACHWHAPFCSQIVYKAFKEMSQVPSDSFQSVLL